MWPAAGHAAALSATHPGSRSVFEPSRQFLSLGREHASVDTRPTIGPEHMGAISSSELLDANLSARLVTVSQWHANVQHRDLRPERLRLAHSVRSIKNRTHLAPESFEERRNHFRRIDVVVGNEHPTADAR